MLGLKKEAIVQHHYNDLTWVFKNLDGEPLSEEILPFQHIQTTGTPVEGVRRALQRPDGRRAILSINAAPLLDADGNFEGMVATVEDITEKALAEEQLQASETKFRQLVQATQEGMWAIDLEGNTTFVNPRMAEMLGYTAEEMLDRHFFSFMGEEQASNVKEKMTRRGQSVRAKYELEFLTKDGQPTATHVETSPLNDEAGNMVGVIASVIEIAALKNVQKNHSSVSQLKQDRNHLADLVEERDGELEVQNFRLAEEITERAQAEELLHLSEERYKALVDQLQAGIVVHAPDTRIVLSNPQAAQLLGLSEEQLAGKTTTDELWHFLREDGTLMPVEDFPVNRVIATGQPLESFVMGVDHPATGNRIWVLVNAFPEFDARQQLRFVIVTLMDVTERQRAEEVARLEDKRLRMVINLTQQKLASLQELLDKTLEELITLSDSKLGYIYYYSEERQEFTLHAWSKSTMAECTIHNPPSVYELAKTGIWGEVVRQHQPIVVNDYLAPNPLKKGIPEGHALLFRFMSVPVFSDGHIVAVVGVANKETDYTDLDVRQLTLLMDSIWKIAERWQAEDALHSKERQLTSIFENVSEVLYFLSVEPDDRFRFLAVNQSFLDVTGLSEELVVGKFVHEVIPEPSLTIVLDNYKLAIRDNKTVRWEEVTDYPTGKKYGEVVVTPIYDANGTCTNLIGSVHDLTEHRRVEEDLRRYREHLEELVSERTAELEANNAQLAREIAERELAQDESLRQAQFPEENPNPVLRVSTDGTLLYANPNGQNLLHAWECTIGDNLPDLWSDIPAWVREENKSIPVEMPVGNQIFEFDVVPVQGREYINLYGKDITERKRAETLSTQYLKEVERSNKELDQFATAASHDLQAPLRTVVGFLQLLKRRAKGQLDPKLSEFVDRAINAGTNMQEMVGGLLTFSRIKVDEENLTVVDCEQALASAMDDQQVSIAELSATITHDPLPTVRGVKSLLTQVFQNLISNALKFHGTDTPVVHVAVAESENDWLFSVQDNGIGFDQQYAESIFSLFRRLHTQEEYPGNGIGLSLCKKIIERHGGTIWAESEIGKGSTFYFTLPKLPAK